MSLREALPNRDRPLVRGRCPRPRRLKIVRASRTCAPNLDHVAFLGPPAGLRLKVDPCFAPLFGEAGEPAALNRLSCFGHKLAIKKKVMRSKESQN